MNDAVSEGDTPEPWYRDGLRFGCTQCGNCCTGGPGAVWFLPAEGEAIASKLGLSHEAFLERFTRRIGSRRSFLERDTVHGHDCIFLDRSTIPGRAVCSIYELRPTQCRTWPFWGEIIESPEAWEDAKRRTPCPGMGEGKRYTFVEITTSRDRDRRREPWAGER